MAPTSLATSPSAARDATSSARPFTAPVERAKVKRTYGRRVEAQPVVEAAAMKQALDRNSTFLVPDSEAATAGLHPHEEDAHSTDPTSEDEEEEKRGGMSSGSDGEDDAMAKFFNRRGLGDLLADVDRDFDERGDDALPIPRPLAYTQNATSSPLPHLTTSEDPVSPHEASPSTHRTPSAAPRQSSHRAVSPSSDPTILDEIEAFLPAATADEDSDAPISRSKPKKAAPRVVDSDDEDAAPAPSRKDKGKQRAILDSSDREDDEEQDEEAQKPNSVAPYPTAPATALSKQDRLAALVAKKRKELPVVEGPKQRYEDTDDMIEGDDEREAGEKKRRGSKKAAPKKSKVKSISKKAEEEMNRQTAAFARTADFRLAPTRKAAPSVAELSKKFAKESYPTPPTTREEDHITLSSNDTIVDGNSSPAPSAPATNRQVGAFKLWGEKNAPASSPIYDNAATPAPNRIRVPPRPAGWPSKQKAEQQTPAPEKGGSDDDELLSLDAVFAKRQREAEVAKKAQEKEARLKKLREQKEAALRAARSQKAAADSDSDFEIEGAPGQATKATSSSSKKLGRTTTDIFEAVKSETPRRNANLNKILRQFGGVDTSHAAAEDEDPTESQLQAAGKEFGRNLDPKQHHVPTPARPATKRSSRPSNHPMSITRDGLDHTLLEKARKQNLKLRVKKQLKYRQQQTASNDQAELAGVDVKALMEKKKEQRDEDEAMEDAEDGDYRATDDEDEEAVLSGFGSDSDAGAAGNGSDVPAGADGRKQGGESGEQDDEGEVDSDGELRMPPSSQNSDRLGGARATQDDEDEQEAPMLPPATKGKIKRKRMLFDDEEDEAQDVASASTAPAPTEIVPSAAAPAPQAEGGGRVALDGLFGGGDGAGGGFSQFFDSQFSQGAGGAGQTDGFLRPAADDFDAPAPTMFAGAPLISTAERAADAARLEARGGFNDFEPGTPREVPAARQYINQQGLLTQTRPANLFDSPSDSPAFSHRQSLSTRDSESQLGETQVQTPTQVSKEANKLRRLGAMVTYGDLPATEVEAAPEPVSDAQAAETQEETQAESMPSAAQPPTAPPKNAFDALRAGAAQQNAPAPVLAPKRKLNSAFVDAEANLSDEEELGLGGVSGDEDENGLDAELESLVDNEEVDKELRDEQDALVDELHAAEMEKQHEADLKRAERIAAGKERNKRKGVDLSDDEFDDEYVRQTGHRKKRERVDNLTTAELKANEETAAFAVHLTDACVATAKETEYLYLEAPEHSDIDEDDYAAEESLDVFGAPVESLPPIKMTFRDRAALAVRRQQDLDAEEDEDVEMPNGDDEDAYRYHRADTVDIHLGGSSSPVPQLKLNNRIVESTTVVRKELDDYEQMESQYSLLRANSVHQQVQYGSGDGRDESQGAATAGGRSAVTSFKRTALGKTASSSAAGAKGKAAALGPKPSKLGAMRKSGFA
ncbi:hypothetical protein JCM10213v2_004628 [Rhodosporidiobolus nylandii]